MNIPGANLLSMVLSVMGNQTINYYQQTGRIVADDGAWVTTYSVGSQIDDCSLQAVDRDIYDSMGLDYQKTYKWLFIPQSMQDLQRDFAGDRFGFNNRKYQLQSATDWQPIDGWLAILCVDIGVDSGVGADA